MPSNKLSSDTVSSQGSELWEIGFCRPAIQKMALSGRVPSLGQALVLGARAPTDSLACLVEDGLDPGHLGSSGPERQRAQLTIPTSTVPKFPFSSPITEEIVSPTSSSSEERDREMERNRPFEFLVKMSTRNAPVHRATPSGRSREDEPKVSSYIATTEEQGGSNSISSSLSSFTARKNLDRPVGLNLDIPNSTPYTRNEAPGAFVDLNDLKVLSKVREDERTATQKIKGILKKGDAGGFQRLPDDPSDSSRTRRKRASLLGPSPNSPKKRSRDDGISPTDRPIVIGYSVPFDSPEFQDEKPKELDSAGTLQTPLTPSIMVTPAKEDSFWLHLSPEHTRPRVASSVYSQPSPYLGQVPSNVPPVPALPALYSTGNESNTNIDSVRKRRSFSTGTLNEKVEDEDALPAGRSRSYSNEKIPRPSDRLTINTTLNARASTGWWNYILSPLLSRTSTLLSRMTPTTETRPPLPAITTHSAGLSSNDEWWKEKERSYFSPDTPEATEAARRISSWQNANSANPFADFDWSIEEQTPGFHSSSPKNKGTTDRGVASIMFSGQRIEGAAAEYYQACAHELFSKTPYFECINHVCSITPKDKIPVVTAASPTIQSTHGDSRGLLIDVDIDDIPRSQSIHDLDSPKSGITSINSSPSDDASVRMSRELRVSTSYKSSRGALTERTPGTPKTSSPGLASEGLSRTINSLKSPSESQSTNPFLLESREAPTTAPAPAPSQAPPPAAYPPANIHIESAPAPPPANIYIQAPAAQPAPNIYFQPPAAFAPPEPPMAPPVPENTNPFEPPAPEPAPLSRAAPIAAEPPMPTPASAARTAPPPIAMPSPDHIPPPSYGAQPPSPYPRSPESLQERGAIRLTNMPAGPAPAYTPRENVGLPASPRPVRTSGQDRAQSVTERGGVSSRRMGSGAMFTQEDTTHLVTEQQRLQSQRMGYEREETTSKKPGALSKVKALFAKKSCLGRKKNREGNGKHKLKKRWWLLICLLFLSIVIGAVLLAIFLTHKGDGTPVGSQWLNLTGYPPMPTGISTIAGPEARTQESGCINPSSMWSCALPKEEQAANEPYSANQPNFRVEIRFQNGSYDHSTTLASRSLPLNARSANQLFNPSPSPPSTADQKFLGRTTDGNSEPYAGEETPFYITLLTTEHVSSQLSKRESSNSSSSSNDTDTTTDPFPDLGSLIPSPATQSDGSAAAAVLYPHPSSQPIRLYNRDKDDEHYGFYTYFDKSIFLASNTPLTGKKDNEANDTNGGSTREDARVRCTWSQTRFLVQIWTKGEKSGKSLFNRETTNSTSDFDSDSSSATGSTDDTSSASSSATDFTRPGSFPYPVTITLDRHGGQSTRKMVYCYGMEEDTHINGTEKKYQIEDRAVNGQLINPAPGIFNITSSGSSSADGGDEGGYDGGTGGCSCQWVNWVGS
ncbi:hypothetical protein BJY01DRAFT_256880 [Aspergillus pseudoustus]|uniref:Glycoprotease family-domain-containing protein n=1 Tax=Aspergillus pseudoustus TaxID=1810923 RepID=A0ABR4JPD8_9EURO